MKDEARARLARAARAFLEKKPWERLASGDYVLVRDQETREEGWASILGREGEEFGLALYLGRDSRSTLDRMLARDLTEEEQGRHVDLLALTVADPAEATRLRERMLLDERVDVGGKHMVPTVFRVERGRGTRPLRDREALFLARALEGLALAFEHGLEPKDARDATGARLILDLAGRGESVALESSREQPEVALAADLQAALHARGRTKRAFAGVVGDRIALVDAKEGAVLDEDWDPAKGVLPAARRLIEALAGLVPTSVEARLPRELWVEPEELAATLQVALAPLGVKVVPKSGIKELARRR
jgi:hypothetical protein